MYVWFLLITFFIIDASFAYPAKNQNVFRDKQLIGYLEKYGYLDESQANNKRSVNSAVRRLQKYARIPETGIIDDETIKLINTPRCGVPDIIKNEPRHILFKPWLKRNLTYSIGHIPAALTMSEVQTSMRNAFNKWASHVDLSFIEVDASTTADIETFFAFRDHGCGKSFDGPKGELAHSFFPQIGDIHFDEDEPWAVGGSSGTDFLSVCLHEIGHALGLRHSNVPGAVMSANYRIRRELTEDDINGIQTLYPKL